jgi:hypothetical protein
VLIAVVGVVVAWSVAAVLSAPASGASGPLASTGATHAHPSLCDLPCGGTGDFETITVEVTGVPQYYTLAGGCVAYPANDANCQVFVPLNLAFTSTYSTQGDIQEIPVEPGSHAYTFLEPVGGTGFYASYNVDECNLPDPWNGCFEAAPPNAGIFNHPGVDTSPYYYVGPAATKFVPGCNGAPFGQIFGPNAAADGSTTIVLTYDLCPGTPADDGGGDGGNSSWNDTNGSSDPCVNDTGDLNCLNATVGDLNFTDVATPTGCSGCVTVMNTTLPITVAEHGVVRAFLWNGTYSWSLTFQKRAVDDPGGVFTLAPDGHEAIAGDQFATHPTTFTETGLPAGSPWTLWLNGTSVTTTGASITLREPNGSTPWFALAGGGGKAVKTGYAASLQGSTSGQDYGVVDLNGDGIPDLLTFEPVKATHATFDAKAPADERGEPRPGFTPMSMCVALRPAALPFVVGPFAPNAVPGIVECGPASATHPSVDVPLPIVGGTSGGAIRSGLPAGASAESVLYEYHLAETAALKHPTSFEPHSQRLGVAGPVVHLTPGNGTIDVIAKPVKHTATSVEWATANVTFSVTCDGNPVSGSTVSCAGDSSHGKTSFCTQPDVPGNGGGPTIESVCAKFPGHGSAGSSVTVGLVNGTYNLSIAPIHGYWANVGGVTVSGEPPVRLVMHGDVIDVAVEFVPRTYNVTFTESGLPPGTEWAVSIPSDPNGADPTHDWTSTTSTITVALPNGTAKFSVVPVSGYTSSAKPTSVKVHGSPAQVPTTFRPDTGGGPAGLPLGLFGAFAIVPAMGGGSGRALARRAAGICRSAPAGGRSS